MSELPPFSLLRDFSFQNTSEHFAIRFRQSYLIWAVYDVTAIELNEGIRMAPNYRVSVKRGTLPEHPGTPRNTPEHPRNTPGKAREGPGQPCNTPGTSHNTLEHPRNRQGYPQNTKIVVSGQTLNN